MLIQAWHARSDSYEVLYPLCSGVSTRLAAFEAHLIRIYSPTYGALHRIPEMWADGSVRRMTGQLWDSAIAGDGLVLGQRLAEKGVEMGRKLGGMLGDHLVRWKELRFGPDPPVGATGGASGSGAGAGVPAGGAYVKGSSREDSVGPHRPPPKAGPHPGSGKDSDAPQSPPPSPPRPSDKT